MAIVKSADTIPSSMTCAVCGVNLTPDKATAGLFDGHNHQAFACISHFLEVEKLIVGWADFIAAERRKCLERGKEPSVIIYGGSNAWLNS